VRREDLERRLDEPLARLEAALLRAPLGGVSAHVAAGAPVGDPNGGYARWFASHGAKMALQRPDLAVFGAAPTLAGAGALVRELRSRLG
jgi:hypothetical protein